MARAGVWKRAMRKKMKRGLKALPFTMGEYHGKLGSAFEKLANREWHHVKKICTGVGDEMASILLALNLFPLGLVNFERLQFVPSLVPKRPILLIHGYFHNNSVFYVLKRRLAREGWKHVYSINLPTYSRGIEECAREISQKVRTIINETKIDRVDLIGHSFGGLCARYYIQALDGANKVNHCITIATPHKGTTLSFFGLGAANLDMQPGSDLLQELNKDLTLPDGVDFTNIWSPFDYMIIPIENAIMEGRVRNIKIDHVGHLGLLFSQKVFNELFLSLSSDLIQRKLAPVNS